MSKKVVAAIVVVVVVIVVVAVFLMGGKKASDNSDTVGGSVTYDAVKACDVFTLSEAKELMGDATTAGVNTGPASSSDVNVDTCSYTNNATSVPAIRTATVMVRSALTADGLESNKAAFESGGAAYPTGAEAVSGYGEKAYWDPASHQLAILKGNTWIGIVYGGTNPVNNTLADARLVADKVAR